MHTYHPAALRAAAPFIRLLLLPCLFVMGAFSRIFADVPVPQPTLANESELLNFAAPYRTFTIAEVGQRVTMAAMHRGYLILSGGAATVLGDSNGTSRVSSWRLSPSGTPNLVQPSKVGELMDLELFKTHNMGFQGEVFQVRSRKFKLYQLNTTGAAIGAPSLVRDHNYGFNGGSSSSHSSCWAGRYFLTGGEGYGTASGVIDIFDCSNPAAPVWVRTVDVPAETGFRAASVYVLGNLMIVSASEGNGMATYDFSDPRNPQLLDTFSEDAAAFTYTSWLSGNRVYAGGQQGGLFIYDVSNPSAIELVDQIPPSLMANAFPKYPVVQDEYVHFAAFNNSTYVKVRVDALPLNPLAIPAGTILTKRIPALIGPERPELALPIGNLCLIGNSSEFEDKPAAVLVAHAMLPDTRPPVINAVRPVDGETNVAESSMIGISFTDFLESSTVNSSTVIVRPIGGSAISGIYSQMGGIVNFTPSSALLPNTTYEIVVPAGGVKDCVGNAVNAGAIFRFSTGAEIDTTSVGTALWYPLDESTGTVANDASLSGENGVLNNFAATPPWTAGVSGRGALAFDGVDDSITGPSLQNIGAASRFTVSGWVYPRSGTGGLHTILANSGGGLATAGFRLFTYGSTHASAGQLRVETGDGTTHGIANTAAGALPFDQWTHVAVAVDRISGQASIYMNGADRTVTSGVRQNFAVDGALSIGRMATSYPYFGLLDDFRIYPSRLSADEVKQLVGTYDSPMAHWRFNNTTASAVSEGAAATLTLTTYHTDDTREGVAALAFNGTTAYATLPAIECGQRFSIATWVRPNVLATTQTWLANTSGAATANGLKLRITTAGRVQVETGNGTVGLIAQTGDGAIAAAAWSHVAVNVDRSAGIARIFVNGVDLTTGAGTIRTDFLTRAPIFLGRTSNAATPYGGLLDDVRIYPCPLDTAEIRELSIGKLLAHWKFEGTDADESGFGRNLTRNGGAHFTSEAVRGLYALQLDGVDDSAAASTLDTGNQFTVSIWGRLTSTAVGSRTLFINNNGGYAGNGMRWFIHTWNTDNRAVVFETGNGTAGRAATAPSGTVEFNQWNHFALVVDKTLGQVSMYYNRKRVVTNAPIRNDFATSNPLHIGRLITLAGFGGQLDDMRIYGLKLSEQQLGLLGRGGPNEAPVIESLLSSDSTATAGSSVNFTANVVDPNIGEDRLYRFDFGDGTSTNWGTSLTASRIYSAPGRYAVTIFASDGIVQTSRTITQIVYNLPTALAPSISGEMAYEATRGAAWVVVPDGEDTDSNPATPPVGLAVRINGTSNAADLKVALGNNVEPVALAARPGGSEIWVVCKRSSEIKIINAQSTVAATAVLQTLNAGRGSAPVGVAFSPDGTVAYVVCEGSEAIQRWNASTRVLTATVDLGGVPRGVAVSSTGRVFVSRFRSSDTGGTVWECNPSTVAITRTIAIAADTTTSDSSNAARGIANYISQIAISPDGQKAWFPAKKDNIFRGRMRDGEDLTHETTVRSLIGQISLTSNGELAANRLDLDDTGMTVAMCFSPLGDLAFATAIGNEHVAVIDTASRNTLAGISTADAGVLLGYGPSGLCINTTGTKLFVHNFLERRVRVFDVSSYTQGTGATAVLLANVALITTEPLTTTVLRGKKLFYNSEDPRLARDGYIACASCHLGGDHDARTWDLSQFGEGLRNTIDLRGHGGMAQGRLHWSGNFNEIQDFEGQIRGLSRGTGLITGSTPHPPFGTANLGRSTDLDALAAYVTSLNVVPTSPFRTATGALTIPAGNGQTHFTNIGCTGCHSGTQMTNSSGNVRFDVGTINAQSGSRLNGALGGIDTPTLRGVWAGAPYLHRGQAADLADVFTTANAPGTAVNQGHVRFRELLPAQQTELLQYLLELE